MNISKFPISFWPVLRAEEFTEDWLKNWEDAGVNYVSLDTYDMQNPVHQKAVQRVLDWCKQTGSTLIVRDSRLRLESYRTLGPDGYAKNVQAVDNELKDHPLASIFYITDEPEENNIEDVCNAYRIVAENAPGRLPLVNFLPWWKMPYSIEGIDWTDRIANKTLAEFLDRYLKETNAPLLSYDYYAGLLEHGCGNRKAHFANLRTYANLAIANKADFWQCMLSVPHFNYRVSGYDDLRWQVNCALAYGCRGISWFTLETPIIGTFHETNYRNAPVDAYGERTPLFADLRRVNREIHERWNDIFLSLRPEKIMHYPRPCDPICETFSPYGVITDITLNELVWPVPGAEEEVIISHMRSENGEPYLFFVNASPLDSVKVTVTLNRSDALRRDERGREIPVKIASTENGLSRVNFWLAPGQGELFRFPDKQ